MICPGCHYAQVSRELLQIPSREPFPTPVLSCEAGAKAYGLHYSRLHSPEEPPSPKVPGSSEDGAAKPGSTPRRPGRLRRSTDLIRNRESYGRRREAAIAKVRQWQAEHPDRFAAILASRKANQRATRAGTPGHISADDVQRVWAASPNCVVCGIGRGLDHIVPLSRGGTNTPENLQNLCVRCNSYKGRRLPGEPLAAEKPRACHCCGGDVFTRGATHCSRSCGQRHRHAISVAA